MRQRNALYLTRVDPPSRHIAMLSRPQQAFQPQRASSPISSLPVELLAYIFVLGTHEPISQQPERDDNCQPFNSESVKAPLLYASVSRHWRSVALNTPALYTSLCITPELLRDAGSAEVLDTTPIVSYLALSRNYLVDILIDARDQAWDFEDESYQPWFTAQHMTAAMAVLLPHLGRWRSLSILTDLYAPMDAALRPLEAYLTTYTAPHLESLRLMRCDAYISHCITSISETDHVFMTFATDCPFLFPSLKHLALRGVPSAWGALAGHIPEDLQTLELSYHASAEQPSIPELARLLSAASHLTRLVMNGSGPLLFDSDVDPSTPTDNSGTAPISLPELKSLLLGYTSSEAGLAFFHLLSAPNVQTLTLEDTSVPAAMIPIDAAPLLAHLFPPAAAPEAHPFPALADLRLWSLHIASPAPPVRAARLELVGMTPSALAFECSAELCVRAPPDADAKPAGPALRALIEAQGARAPRLVSLHETYGTLNAPAAEADEYVVGGTCVRVFRGPEEEGSEDEDTVMGSDLEYGGMDEDDAFKPGGVFNDPAFDARYGAAMFANPVMAFTTQWAAAS
ncbi:hypothetical protein C8R43DRAFT_968452 [Mycena crocata]|nr:hypothetical protein C8R43DRAFT_968452 [Mycena crocata]